MKLVLLIGFCFIIAACSVDEKAVNSSNQKSVNINTSALNQNPTVSNTAKSTPNVSGKTARLGETMVLKGGESGIIKDTGLGLKVVTVGSASLPANSQNSQPQSAIPFCRVEATLNGKTEGQQLYVQSGRNELIFEGFKIQIQNAIPVGEVNCSFIVTKVGK
ncbi:hypothetical protein BH10ACI1_BH10ACI1_14580 [soil metagenome]